MGLPRFHGRLVVGTERVWIQTEHRFEAATPDTERPTASARPWRTASGATFLFADDITSGTYALGWHRTTFEGHPYLSHGGGIFGFPAYVALLPDIAAGVVVLANGEAWFHPHHEISAWVFARLLGGGARDWHGESMAIRPRSSHRARAPSPRRIWPASRELGPLCPLMNTWAAMRTRSEPATPRSCSRRAGGSGCTLASPARSPATWSTGTTTCSASTLTAGTVGPTGVRSRPSPELGVAVMDLGFMGQYRRREG